MKSFRFLLLAGAAALLIAGCSTAVSPEKAAQVDPAKTGLILATLGESEVANAWAEFVLHPVDGHDSLLPNRAINTTKKLWLIEVPPGRYRLAGWTVTGGGEEITGKAKPTARQEFEFEVKPGEVTYLGHFVTAIKPVRDAANPHRVFAWAPPVLEDRAKEAIDSFRQQYPALAAVPVRSVAPLRLDLVPTTERRVARYGLHYYSPDTAKENENGTEQMPSGPRWP